MTDTTSRLPRALRPLSDPQYRRLLIALTFSLFSAGCWLVASVWQVVQLGGRPTDLSFVAAGASLGLIVAVLFGGITADRIPQRRILLTCEAVRGVAFATAAVLALSGAIQIWHLALVAFVLGLVDGFFYPAWSAWLPSILPADRLLAANGLEGMMRPAILQAAGPAVASALIAVASPGWAFLLVAVLQIGAATALSSMRTTPVRREPNADEGHVVFAALRDMRDGVRFMVRTRWLFATLLFAILAVLATQGPIEVLLPFAITDQTGGGAGSFALALASFGIGGAIGSLTTASFRLPRRYLTLMILAWSIGGLPLALIGYTSQLWVMVAALFVVGFMFSAAQVIWGTLLQRRVPPAMLGRVSSLDFFVSLALMPLSMALAGPIGEAIGIGPTFVYAAVIGAVLGIATIFIARLGRDELAHPLDDTHVDTTAVTGGEVAMGLRPPADERH